MIANSGHDERGKFSGGNAGDQTGSEWQIREWYKYPYGWNCVLRHPNKSVARKIAELAKSAAKNNNIGYDQYQRLTFWYELVKSNYDPAKIKNKCESDCSAGVAAIVKATGYLLDVPILKEVSPTNYTGSLKPNLRAAGFEVLTDEKYLTSDKYLKVGDIILNEKHHTCINLDDGSMVTPENKEGWQKTKDGKWWYQYKDGSYPKSCWKVIKGKDYYFDSEGYLVTKEFIKSADYKSNGKLYWVDKDGAWDNKVYKWEQKTINKKVYWTLKSSDGKWSAKSEWYRVDGKWYYFNDKSYMVTGTKTIDGKIYSFRLDGSLVE